MSGAARAAWLADGVIDMAAGRETDNPVRTVASLPRAPHDVSPPTTNEVRPARLSLVMPADAAMRSIVFAAAGYAEAGVC